MEVMQLLSCSEELHNCCDSYVLANVLHVTQNIFSLIQIIVPIILIVATTIQLVQLTINPELKDGNKRILNKVIATFIIFLLPILVDAVIGVFPNSFSVVSCWEEAPYISNALEGRYIDDEEDSTRSKTSILINPSDFDRPVPKSSDSGDNSNNPNAKVAAYAKKFVGKPYKMGGNWDGSERYTAADCCGFIIGAYKHFGVNFGRPCYGLLTNTKVAERISESELRAGDIVIYEPKQYWHFAILTGNGEEIVHAANSKDGVKISSTYKYRKVKAFVRIKGVK